MLLMMLMMTKTTEELVFFNNVDVFHEITHLRLNIKVCFCLAKYGEFCGGQPLAYKSLKMNSKKHH